MQIWFKTVEHAYATGDTASIKAISDPSCEACDRFVSDINEHYDEGGSFRGVHAELSNIVAPALEQDLIGISVRVAEPSSERLSADGTVEGVTRTQPPSNTTFWAGWDSGRWVAAEVVNDQS